MKNAQLTRAVLYGFWIVSACNLAAQTTDIIWLDLSSKPLLMLLLMLYLWRSVGLQSMTSRLLAMALFFSWLGDVLLMLQPQHENLFIWGLAAFLVAHLCYMVTYHFARGEVASAGKSYQISRVIMLLVAGLALLYLLWPGLGALKLPVTAYTCVIIAMAVMAVLRRGRTTEKSFVLVYSGALLFIMSDAMLAIQKFLEPIYMGDLWVMGTYIVAQFLIVKGLIFHENAVTAAES